MLDYDLDFIEKSDLIKHINNTILQYSKSLKGKTLEEFNSNIIDPIKFLFDSLVFNKTIEEVINSEIIRQKDKTNNNIIGYFHQNIFKYFKNKEWYVPIKGFDIVNDKEKIYVEMKNKHNTMNSASSQKTYLNMMNKIEEDYDATCYLVIVIAKRSENIPWKIVVDGRQQINDKIRKISIDNFYKLVTGQDDAFYKLCKVLPALIKEVLENLNNSENYSKDTVVEELSSMTEYNDIIESLFSNSFSTYKGWKK